MKNQIESQFKKEELKGSPESGEWVQQPDGAHAFFGKEAEKIRKNEARNSGEETKNGIREKQKISEQIAKERATVDESYEDNKIEENLSGDELEKVNTIKAAIQNKEKSLIEAKVMTADAGLKKLYETMPVVGFINTYFTFGIADLVMVKVMEHERLKFIKQNEREIEELKSELNKYER